MAIKNKMAKPRALIAGIGGIGGVIAGCMAKAGYAPVLVTNNEAITDAIRDKGLRLTMHTGKSHTTPDVYTTLDDVPDDVPFDAAFLVMKAQAVVETAQAVISRISPDGYVATFQNGIVEDGVAEAVGRERVIGVTIGWGGTMIAPGVYERTSPGNTLIGELDGSTSERLRALAAALETAGPVVMSENIMGVKWSKLAVNSTVTTIGALTGETLGEMLARPEVRRLCLAVYSEGVNTALAAGVQLERIAADPMMMYVPEGAGWFTRWRKDLFMRFVGRKYGRSKASMLQSLERGRLTEVDYLNGYIVDKAKAMGVATPLNARLVELIHEIERGERKSTPANIAAVV